MTTFLLLYGGIERAWEKCLPHWLELGRVNDFPMDELRNIYVPSFPTRLGDIFVNKYWRDGDFLLIKLGENNVIDLIVFDLLYILHRLKPTASKLINCEYPLNQTILKEIANCRQSTLNEFEGFTGTTIGALFKYYNEKFKPN